MKKNLYTCIAALAFGTGAFAQHTEVVKGGNMEDASAWHFYYNSKDAKDTLGTIEFNYTADKPAAGEGGCYRVSTYGQSATFLWQKISLQPGHKYRFNGAFKNASDSTANTWLEYGIMRTQPTGGEINTSEFSYVFNLNTWMGATKLDVDTTFGKYFPFSGAASNTFILPDTTTDTEWFIVIKTGCWNNLGDKNPTFNLLFDNISVLDLTPNVVKGGNMEDASAWNFYYNSKDAKDTLGTVQFNYTADGPAAGKGGCYRVSTYGQSATFLWQPITVKAGHKYTFAGAFKNASDSTANTWLEYGIMRDKPSGGEINTSQFNSVYNLNTWMGADTLNVNTTFQDYFPLAGAAKNKVISIADTVTDSEWYIVIKTGCWNNLGDTKPTFDLLFDDIALYDITPNVLVGGNMEDSSAWHFYYNVKDAKDTLGTIQFNYTADKPAAGQGGCYRVSTYGQSATFLWTPVTLMPGHKYQLTGAFKNASDSTANTWLEFGIMRNKPGGGEVNTSEMSYVYNLNTWMGADTLNVNTTFEDYFPFSGAGSNIFVLPDTTTDTEWFILIKTGCWNNLGDKKPTFDFLFDEIALSDMGLFVDAQAPSTPKNVVAAAASTDVTLTWDASTDNTSIKSYKIFNGTTEVATIDAKATGNTYTAAGLAVGSYTFYIQAVDAYKNVSEKGKSNTVDITTAINNVNIAFALYPNPVVSQLNIRSSVNINTVTVYNITGQVERVVTSPGSATAQINLESLRSGIYFVKVNAGNNVSISKIIKK